jgi:hypothetical protein
MLLFYGYTPQNVFTMLSPFKKKVSSSNCLLDELSIHGVTDESKYFLDYRKELPTCLKLHRNIAAKRKLMLVGFDMIQRLLQYKLCLMRHNSA